jgi:hypothetical protein
MTKLSADAVRDIFKTVLFKPEEVSGGTVPESAVQVQGLVNSYEFHPERIAAAKPAIDEMLSELPDQFHHKRGGGWSFLNACQDKHGAQWGEHRDMEGLVCLGIAAGSASWIMRDMADILPGGVPYFEIHPEDSAAK